MLRRLRLRRSVWAAIAAGIVLAPALFGGVAAAPTDPNQLPEPQVDPRETPPPDLSMLETRLVLALAASVADLAPEEYRLLVVMAAGRHKVDPRLIASIISVETEWDTHAVGMHGERGLMQILPSTGAYLAREAGLDDVDLANPATNLLLGSLYIAQLLAEHGTVEEALAAYNGGPDAVPHAAENRYARKVLRYYRSREEHLLKAS